MGSVVIALAVGSLGAINTWDLPTYLGLIFCVLLLRGWLVDRHFHVVDAVARFIIIAALSLLLYWPFYQNYQALASGIGLVRSRTPLGYFLVLFGFFIFCIVSFMIVDVMAQRRSTPVRLMLLFSRRFDDTPVIVHRLRRLVHPSDRFKTAAVAVLLLVLVLFTLVVLHQAILALLLPLLLIAVTLGFTGDRKPERVFTLLLLFVALLVALGVEIFFLRDWLQGGSAYRMNTIFKFHIQVWIMLGLASAAGLSVVVERIALSGRKLLSLGTLWYVCLALLLALVLVFPIVGTPARVNDRFPGTRPPTGTLNGMDFMTTGKFSFDWNGKNIPVDLSYEYDAIKWLQENVEGSPVIAEAVLPYYREFGARMSAFTGLPTLVGNQHEQEQRPGDTQVGPRENEAKQIFSDTSFEKIRPLLQKNAVKYIIVGQLEQGIYPAAGLAKFDQAVGQYLDLVYQNQKVKIYEVIDQ
jgi:YYY domain-containing protein